MSILQPATKISLRGHDGIRPKPIALPSDICSNFGYGVADDMDALLARYSIGD